MPHGHAALACRMDMQNNMHDGLAAKTSRMGTKRGHAAWSYSVDLQRVNATWTCITDMQHGDTDMQHVYNSLTNIFLVAEAIGSARKS